MKIEIWNNADKIDQQLRPNRTATYTIEIPNEEINNFVDRFGEKFGTTFGKAIVKGLEEHINYSTVIYKLLHRCFYYCQVD